MDQPFKLSHRAIHPPLVNLRSDVSIDCTSDSYAHFRVLAIVFVILTQTIPILYYVMLRPHAKERLNPVFAGSPQGARILRSNET